MRKLMVAAAVVGACVASPVAAQFWEGFNEGMDDWRTERRVDALIEECNAGNQGSCAAIGYTMRQQELRQQERDARRQAAREAAELNRQLEANRQLELANRQLAEANERLGRLEQCHQVVPGVGENPGGVRGC